MTDPTGRMTGRFRRIARLSGALGGSAVKVAGQRWLGIDFDRSAHSRRLQTILGDLHGPAMKVAQLLAVVPEALPDEYTTAFAKLQTNAPPMGWSFVQRRMCAELGSGWAGRFAAFDREPFAAASLGQVHAATEHDGRLLACKLQYPDMGRMIDADLAQLKLALKLFDKAEGAVTTDAAFAEIAERLREELDYRREAALIRLYGLMLADVPDICVPEPVPDLSTDRLLTMTRLTGAGIETLKETPEDVRAAAARKIMTAWYGPFFSFGVLHGDPHPGNYTFGEDGRLNLMDFGCVRLFEERFVQGVIDLYRAVQTGDDDLAAHAYRMWGFGHLTRDVLDILNRWARFLFEAMIDDSIRPIGHTDGNGFFGRDMALSVYADLKRAGGVTVPREFVFMDRSALGLGSVFIGLDVKLNWHRLFEELIAGFDAGRLAADQERLTEEAGL